MKKKVDKVVARLSRKKAKPRGKAFADGNPWRFPKGKSGNPGGRPKLLGESIAAALAVEVDGKTVAQLVAERLCESAIAGDIAAAREMRQATEGETVHTPDAIQVVIDR